MKHKIQIWYYSWRYDRLVKQYNWLLYMEVHCGIDEEVDLYSSKFIKVNAKLIQVEEKLYGLYNANKNRTISI